MNPKLVSPSRIGRYYHLECARYLRYSSTPRVDHDTDGVPAAPWAKRPVSRAVLDAGYRWEERVLEGELAETAIVAEAEPDKPSSIRDRAHSMEATTRLMATALPGEAIYQGTLRPPDRFYERYGVDPTVVRFTDCRPDLLEIRTGEDGVRLVRVTDFKVSRGLRLSHKIQAALYTLILRDVLLDSGIDGAVDLAPAIWLVNDPEATAFDIRAILPPLETFLERELVPLMATDAADAEWHFNRRCETCDYYEHCRDDMRSSDDLARIPGLTGHAKRYLRSREPSITTVEEFAEFLGTPEAGELDRLGSLRGRVDRIRRQVESLESGELQAHGGSTLALPVGENVRLVFTVQTEPVGGNVFGWAITAQGLRGLVDPNPYTEASVAASSDPEEIRRVEHGLVRAIHRILLAVHDYNVAHDEWKDQKSLQAYAYDTYEEALLTGVLVRALGDADVASEALDVFFHFKHPELLEASDHPQPEAAIPVVVVSRVVSNLLALPVEVTYRFPEVAALLPREKRAFEYREHPYFDFELSNQLRPDAIFSLWNEGRTERAEQINRVLRARVWGASSLIDGVRQRLAVVAPNALFAWPPKFRLPSRMEFHDPLLSRLAFIAQYEATLAYLQVRSARMGPLSERLRTQTTIELEARAGGWYSIVGGGDVVLIGENGFPDRILTPATQEGQRAALLFQDYAYRDRMWAPARLPVALAAVAEVRTDESDRPTAVRLELKPSKAFPTVQEGERYMLDARLVDYNSTRVIDELSEIDEESGSTFVSLLRDPASAPRLRVDDRLRSIAIRVAAEHGMTASQLVSRV